MSSTQCKMVKTQRAKLGAAAHFERYPYISCYIWQQPSSYPYHATSTRISIWADNLIFKSWFVRYKFFFDCYHNFDCFPWDQMSSPNKGRYPPLYDSSFLFVYEFSSNESAAVWKGTMELTYIKTFSFVLLFSRRSQQKCQHQFLISFWWGLKYKRQ